MQWPGGNGYVAEIRKCRARCVVGDERDDSEKKVTLRPRFGQ
jgi:hypothetical protein